MLPIINEAHRLGAYVITVDYLPDNIAHKYSDEYHNISILDKDAVLKLAKQLDIDGILSFAVDPGVVTASYVAEKLGLPFQGSFESISILQDKSKFRAFLTENGFNVPTARGYSADEVNVAIKEVETFQWPVIVKPVDSAGSKGVTKVDNISMLYEAINVALSESHKGCFIIEEFLEKEGYSSDSDCFSIDGKLVCCSFSDQRFDEKAENPFTPAAFSWPSSMLYNAQSELRDEIQRLISLLGLKTGIYNIEARLCRNGKPYIMEVSPRGGGNRLAECVDKAGSTHLVSNTVRAALGMDLLPISDPLYHGDYAEIILHSDRDGLFDGLWIADSIKPFVIDESIWVEVGERVNSFTAANHAIGTLLLHFPDVITLEKAMNDISAWCTVRVNALL